MQINRILKIAKFDMSSSIKPQNNVDLNQGIVHLWSKFSDPSLKEWRSHGQAQRGVNFDFEVIFDLDGQGQSPPKTIGILTKVFYTYGPHMVIIAWTGDELSRGQTRDYRTHRRTDRQTQAKTIPEGQNWPRVINMISPEAPCNIRFSHVH